MNNKNAVEFFQLQIFILADYEKHKYENFITNDVHRNIDERTGF